MKASDIVYRQGKPIDRLSAEILDAIQICQKTKRFGAVTFLRRLFQAIGGAKASGGTHTKGGCMDLDASGWVLLQQLCNLLGFPGWHRAYVRHLWVEHFHGIARGADYAAANARAQIGDQDRGGDGLVGGGRDNGPRLKYTKPMFIGSWNGAKGHTGTYYLKQDANTHTEGSIQSPVISRQRKYSKFVVAANLKIDDGHSAHTWSMTPSGAHLAKKYLTTKKPNAAQRAAALVPIRKK